MFYFITQRSAALLPIRRCLYEHGLPSVCVTPTEALNVTRPTPTAFFLSSSVKRFPADFAARFRARHLRLPLFYLTTEGEDKMPPFDVHHILPITGDPESFYRAFLSYPLPYKIPKIVNVISGYTRDHLFEPYATYCGIPFPLSRKERLLYRYLIVSAPDSVSVEELIQVYRTPGEAKPHTQDILALIKHANVTFAKYFDLPLIVKDENGNYRLKAKDKL